MFTQGIHKAVQQNYLATVGQVFNVISSVFKSNKTSAVLVQGPICKTQAAEMYHTVSCYKPCIPKFKDMFSITTVYLLHFSHSLHGPYLGQQVHLMAVKNNN